MVRKLGSRGIKVPTGFATTADAYWHFIKTNRLEPLIVSKFAEFKAAKATVTEIGSAIRSAILKGEWPEDLGRAIRQAYQDLSERLGMNAADVAVRSSATAEDLPEASFAGQQESFLNVAGGEDALVAACRRCFASLFTDRAIALSRGNSGFDHLKVGFSRSACIKMVRSDRAACGRDVHARHRNGFRSHCPDERRVGSRRRISCKGQLIPMSIRYLSPCSPTPR